MVNQGKFVSTEVESDLGQRQKGDQDETLR